MRGSQVSDINGPPREMHATRFERAALLAWLLTMIGFVTWLLINTLQEYRPAV